MKHRKISSFKLKALFAMFGLLAFTGGLFHLTRPAQAASDITSVLINGYTQTAGDSGPGWSFPEAGRIVLTDANLDSIIQNNSSLTGALEINLNGDNQVKAISQRGDGSLTISGSGRLNMPSIHIFPGGSFAEFLQSSSDLIIKDSVKINIANTGMSVAPGNNYTAVWALNKLSVLNNASFSVITDQAPSTTIDNIQAK